MAEFPRRILFPSNSRRRLEWNRDAFLSLNCPPDRNEHERVFRGIDCFCKSVFEQFSRVVELFSNFSMFCFVRFLHFELLLGARLDVFQIDGDLGSRNLLS